MYTRLPQEWYKGTQEAAPDSVFFCLSFDIFLSYIHIPLKSSAVTYLQYCYILYHKTPVKSFKNSNFRPHSVPSWCLKIFPCGQSAPSHQSISPYSAPKATISCGYNTDLITSSTSQDTGKDIINKLYVTENASKTYVDTELATQIMCSIVDKVKYDEEYKGIWEQTSPERWFSYFSDVSNITGLVTGKTICGGYSEILRNVASCVGLKCKTMVGKTVIDSGHAWNQIELGDTWFNTDLTWAAKEIAAGKPTGDLFMSDAAFFGDRRDMIFEQGKTEVVIGGHERVCNTNGKKCGSYIEPYVTEILMKNVRKYEEKYKTHGKSPDYNGAVPYVGSSIQKMHSSAKDSEKPVDKLH